MKLFVSFASEDRNTAEQIALSLRASHEVFFDSDTLPAGADYNTYIRTYIAGCDGFIFLISPDSVQKGTYALSELEFAKDRWSHPVGHVLPVMIRHTDMDDIPNYLKAITILSPVGNAAAEVAAAVDKMTMLNFLQPLNEGVNRISPLIDSWRSLENRDRQEVASITADLSSLLDELRKTHLTIVKLVSPLRRIPNEPKVFSVEFRNVYNDFRDIYDAYDFNDERTRCHNIERVRNRLERRNRPFGTEAEWKALFDQLGLLGNADNDLIEQHYRPFMQRFNETMNTISDHLENDRFSEAIDAKKDFLASLETEYDKTKAYLKEITETVSLLTVEL